MRYGSACGAAAVVLLAATLCRAEDRDGTYFVRLSYGVGSHMGSEHADLMSKDGYDLTNRRWLAADFAVALHASCFLGGWGGYGWSSAEARHAAPNLEESTVMGGVQVPLLTSGKIAALVLAPRVGAASTKLELYHRGDWTFGPAFGIDVGFFLVHVPLGISAGYTYAPTGAPTSLGRDYQSGGAHLLFSGVIDDF